MYTNKHLNNLNLAKSSREDTDLLQTPCNVLFGYIWYYGYFGFHISKYTYIFKYDTSNCMFFII